MNKKGKHMVDETSTGLRYMRTSNNTEALKFYLKATLLGVAAISTWRGLWLLSDLFIFPNDLVISGVVSVCIGLILFIIYGEIRL